MEYPLSYGAYLVGAQASGPSRGGSCGGEEMSAGESPISLESEYCSGCLVCVSSCPFDALHREKGTGEIAIDIEKCQVCGVCYSGCPAGAIKASYYDFDSLMHYLDCVMRPEHLRTVVLTCRGSLPSGTSLHDVVNLPKFISLHVPCVGRVPVEFLMKTISMDVNKVVLVTCREKNCHYQDGSGILKVKVALLRKLLQQLGYGYDILAVETFGSVASIDEARCALCLTCLRICRYGAPTFDGTGTMRIEVDAEKCTGCGVCVGECPAKAIEVRHERI